MARVKRVSMNWCELPEESGWEVTALCRGSCANRRTTGGQLLRSFPHPILTSLSITWEKYSSLGYPGLHLSRSFLLLPIFPTSSTVLAKCFINLYLNLFLKYNRYTEKGTEGYIWMDFQGPNNLRWKHWTWPYPEAIALSFPKYFPRVSNDLVNLASFHTLYKWNHKVCAIYVWLLSFHFTWYLWDSSASLCVAKHHSFFLFMVLYCGNIPLFINLFYC